jgi:hypothetical protein
LSIEKTKRRVRYETSPGKHRDACQKSATTALLPVQSFKLAQNSMCENYSLYATKVACTAAKRKATLFLKREVIVG